MDAGVAAAIVASVPATIGSLAAWRSANKTHNEVRTNHGVRAGSRIESLGDDMAFLRRVVVTKDDLREHADHDVEVATALAESVETTKQELLEAIESRN